MSKKNRKYIQEVLQPQLLHGEVLQHWAIAKTKISLWNVLLAPIFLFLAPLIVAAWSAGNIKLSGVEGIGVLVGLLIAVLIIVGSIYFFRKSIYKYGVGLTNQQLIIFKIGKKESEPMQYSLTNLTKSIVSVGLFANLIIKNQKRTIKLVFANTSQDNREEGVEIMKALRGYLFPTSSQPISKPTPIIEPNQSPQPILTPKPLIESIPKQPEQMEIEKPPAYTPPPNQAIAWIRGLALLVDVILIIGIPLGIVLEASRHRASIGKLIFKLKVVEDRDKPLTLVRIIVRNIIKWGTLPLWAFYIPFYYLTNIKPLFTKPITTLQDILTLTSVVRNIKEAK